LFDVSVTVVCVLCDYVPFYSSAFAVIISVSLCIFCQLNSCCCSVCECSWWQAADMWSVMASQLSWLWWHWGTI